MLGVHWEGGRVFQRLLYRDICLFSQNARVRDGMGKLFLGENVCERQECEGKLDGKKFFLRLEGEDI